MRVITLILLLAASVSAQEVTLEIRPDSIYAEGAGGSIVPMERIFFHILVENKSGNPVEIQWIRFDLVNSMGSVLSGQYSGTALINLFDNAMDRRRIEPTTKATLTIEPGQRKAISDVFMDLPLGFIGENLLLEVDYKSDGKDSFTKVSTQINRTQGFSGRLPFDGVWYVAAEHGFLDAHKRFLAEAYAYDFIQIGSGKSFQRDGKNNADYYAYGKKVVAAKDGVVVFVRNDIIDNSPGETNTTTPGGNVVIIDHGNSQYGLYGHLKARSTNVKVGMAVHAGDQIGEVGNSGDSVEPQLHFHVMNNPDPAQADGIPVVFENWKSQSYSRNPVTRQGTIPRGEFVQP